MTEREQFLERRVAQLERELKVERTIKVGQHKRVIHTVKSQPGWGRKPPSEPPIDRFISALVAHGFAWEPKDDRNYLCQCPAHRSDGMKLAVSIRPDRLLVKCWSQECNVADIAGAIGLRVSDLFGDEYDGISTLNPSQPRFGEAA